MGRERDLQAWVPTNDLPPPSSNTDEDTFGTTGGTSTTSWDQFTANEQLFGVKASFDEDVYTTKLDRSAPDYKEREREAQRIANEILGVCETCNIPASIPSTCYRLRPTTLTSPKSVESVSMIVAQMRRTSEFIIVGRIGNRLTPFQVRRRRSWK